MLWLLLGSACYAFRRSYPEPGLMLYFLLQAVATLLGMVVLWFHGETSRAYAHVYAVLTALILLACWNIVRHAMQRWNAQAMAAAAILAVILGRAAFLSLGHPPRYQDWIGISEATGLLFCGLLIGACLPRMARWDIGLVLFCLWMGLAVFRFGFYIHLPAPSWIAANWMVPSGLCVAAFTLTGYLAGKPAPNP